VSGYDGAGEGLSVFMMDVSGQLHCSVEYALLEGCFYQLLYLLRFLVFPLLHCGCDEYTALDGSGGPEFPVFMQYGGVS
jgi:hypothetical protein